MTIFGLGLIAFAILGVISYIVIGVALYYFLKIMFPENGILNVLYGSFWWLFFIGLFIGLFFYIIYLVFRK